VLSYSIPYYDDIQLTDKEIEEQSIKSVAPDHTGSEW
jgi:hypothetical protein